MTTKYMSRRAAGVGAGLMLALALMNPLDARQGPGVCRVSGRATSGAIPLPGVSITVKTADSSHATSTEADGAYAINVAPGQYTLSAELTGFSRVERAVVVAADGSCAQTVNLSLALAPRQPLPAAPRAPQQAAAPTAAGGAMPRGRGNQPGFETVQVQPQADAAGAQLATTAERDVDDAATRLLLPPGFSTDAPADAIAITGNSASVDRGMMNDRFGAIGRGEFDPATGDFGAGFGGDQGRGRGGPGGPGGFQLGGRGGQQQRFNTTTNYTFGGSALDSAPYQLRPDSVAGKQPYSRNTFGGTFGGPLIIPGVYNGTRKTNVVLTYNGNRGSNLFDQYATVPTAAMRAGDYSAGSVPLVDPVTHQPFPGNQIPANRIDPAAQALLRFIPLPNLAGTSRNFHNTGTTQSALDIPPRDYCTKPDSQALTYQTP